MHNESGNNSVTDSVSSSIEQIGEILCKVNEAIIGVDVYGCCTFANSKALEYLLAEMPSQIIGTPILQHISFNKDFTQSSVLGYIRQLKNSTESNRSGYILTQKGDIKDIRIWQQPLTLVGGYSGSIIGFEVEEKNDNAQLNSSIDRYKLLIESTQVVLWEYDLSSRHFTFVSPQAEEVFGYPIRLWLSLIHI